MLELGVLADCLRSSAEAAGKEKQRVMDLARLDEERFRERYAGRVEALTEIEEKFNKAASEVHKVVWDPDSTSDDGLKIAQQLKEDFSRAQQSASQRATQTRSGIAEGRAQMYSRAIELADSCINEFKAAKERLYG